MFLEEEGFEEEVEAKPVEEVEEKEVVEIKVELLKQMLEVSRMWRKVLSGEANIEELTETASSRAVLKPVSREKRGKRGKSSRKTKKAGSRQKSKSRAKSRAKARKTGK